MQLLTSAATLRYKAQHQKKKEPGAETMRIKLIDAASVRDQQVFRQDAAVKRTSGHLGRASGAIVVPPWRE